MVAEQAGIEAEWRVADAAISAARQRHARLDTEAARIAATRRALEVEPDPAAALATAEVQRAAAAAMLAEVGETRRSLTQRRDSLFCQARKAPPPRWPPRVQILLGIEREASALTRDRAARDQAAARAGRRQTALGGTRVAPGYERALAAALGRDAAAPLGAPAANAEGRFWTGAEALQPRADSLVHHA